MPIGYTRTQVSVTIEYVRLLSWKDLCIKSFSDHLFLPKQESTVFVQVILKFLAVVIMCDNTIARRDFMYAAHEKGMTGPEWVYIYYTLLPGDDEVIPWVHGENITEEEMEFRKAAHLSLKQVSLHTYYTHRSQDEQSGSHFPWLEICWDTKWRQIQKWSTFRSLVNRPVSCTMNAIAIKLIFKKIEITTARAWIALKKWHSIEVFEIPGKLANFLICLIFLEMFNIRKIWYSKGKTVMMYGWS